VHRYHLKWSRDGTWERIAERLAGAVRQIERRDGTPSPASSMPTPHSRGCRSGEHRRNHHVGVEVVNHIHPSRFEVLLKRWIGERT
jgi:hypothetical protein